MLRGSHEISSVLSSCEVQAVCREQAEQVNEYSGHRSMRLMSAGAISAASVYVGDGARAKKLVTAGKDAVRAAPRVL